MTTAPTITASMTVAEAAEAYEATLFADRRPTKIEPADAPMTPEELAEAAEAYAATLVDDA